MVSEAGYMATLAIAGAVRERNQSYEDEIAALRDHIQTLTTALAVETANSHALQQVMASWEKQHPTSPLMFAEKFTYQDGSPKTISRVLFQSHFDKKLKELGIANPVRYRKD